MKTVVAKIFVFFDKLEDRVRGKLSHYPIIYSLIGGTAIIVFWHGITVVISTVDYFNTLQGGIILIFLGVSVLLLIGLMVSFFVGDTIIISGIKSEKKAIEKTEEEIKSEDVELHGAIKKINHMEKILEDIEAKQK